MTVLLDERQRIENPEQYDAVICNSLFLYNDIKLFSRLKYIQLLSVGYDRVPYTYIRETGIEIHNAHDVYSIPIAEFVIARILDFYKKSQIFFENQRKVEWRKDRELGELYGKSVLIVGYGNIGTEIAKRLQAFGVHIVGINRKTIHNSYIDESRTIADLNAVVKDIDILICTLPLTDDTRHLIGKEVFRLMKETALLVNVSRGEVICTSELIDALEKKEIAGAILDVFEEEPLSSESILWKLPNVLVSPHNAFIGEGNECRLQKVILEHLLEWLSFRNCGSF